MTTIFYLASAVALGSAVLAVSRTDAVHALLYLVVTYLAVALDMLLLGAPFAAALELIVYAGAIVVMFVFAVMILNLGPAAEEAERRLLSPSGWAGPSVLAAILLGLLGVFQVRASAVPLGQTVDATTVGITLWGPYLLAVELASMLLLGALVGAMHLGRKLVDDPAALTGFDEESAPTVTTGRSA